MRTKPNTPYFGKACLSVMAAFIMASFFMVATAQPYSVDWFTVDGGGGASANGQYSIDGTMGQADAGHLSGGSFSLDGGFWSIVAAVQPAGSPTLTIRATAPAIVALSWPSPSPGFMLQQNTNGLGTLNWSNVVITPSDDGTTKTVLVNPASGIRFFRLKGP